MGSHHQQVGLKFLDRVQDAADYVAYVHDGFVLDAAQLLSSISPNLDRSLSRRVLQSLLVYARLAAKSRSL